MYRPWLRFTHEYWREQLSAQVDGRLDAREAAALEAHLATCDRCRTEQEQTRQTVALLRRIPAAPPPRSFALRPADVESAPESGGWAWLGAAPLQVSPLRLGMQWATAAAGILLLAVASYDVGVNEIAVSRESASLSAPAPDSAPVSLQEFQAEGARSAAGAPPPAAAPQAAGGTAQDTAAAGPAPRSLAAGGTVRVPQTETKAADTAAPGSNEVDQAQGMEYQTDYAMSPIRIAELALGIIVIAGGASLGWGLYRRS